VHWTSGDAHRSRSSAFWMAGRTRRGASPPDELVEQVGDDLWLVAVIPDPAAALDQLQDDLRAGWSSCRIRVGPG